MGCLDIAIIIIMICRSNLILFSLLINTLCQDYPSLGSQKPDKRLHPDKLPPTY